MASPGSGSEGAGEAAKMVWNEGSRRLETEDKEAYLVYELKQGGRAMDIHILHTYVPPSKRGLGLAALLSESAFSHAKAHSLTVIPSCSYISDTFLPRNPSWNSIVYRPDIRSQI